MNTYNSNCHVSLLNKVEKQLRKLDTGIAPSLDSVPSWVLEDCRNLQQLTSFHIYGVVHTFVPSRKRTARAYRAISMTAMLCKEMEEFVVKRIWDIVHALVDLLHQCYSGTYASKQYAWILLLDFSKAFDLINQNIFLQTLASFGVPNISMKWIASVLTERSQQVKLCNTQSD